MRTRYAANERAAGLGQDTCGDQAATALCTVLFFPPIHLASARALASLSSPPWSWNRVRGGRRSMRLRRRLPDCPPPPPLPPRLRVGRKHQEKSSFSSRRRGL